MASRLISELASLVNAEVIGPDDRLIDRAVSFDKALPGAVTFLTDDKLLRRLSQCKASACLVSRKHAGSLPQNADSPTWLLVDDPQDRLVQIIKLFRPVRERPQIGISTAAYISPSAKIGRDCNIYPGAFVDDESVIGDRCDIYPGATIGRGCQIGDETIIHARAVLYDDVQVGQRVLIHAGAVLGADGFGYKFRQGRYEKIPQLGQVIIEDDCEIGANTTIDRGTIGATIIGAGTKLDNLVMIGHNCELGKHNAFASQVGLAGSVTTGDYVRCAGQVGIADHVHLGQGCTLGAKSGVHKDIPAGETHVGYPAGPEQEMFRVVMSLNKVPEMRKQLRNLEQKVEEISGQVEQFSPKRAAG